MAESSGKRPRETESKRREAKRTGRRRGKVEEAGGKGEGSERKQVRKSKG